MRTRTCSLAFLLLVLLGAAGCARGGSGEMDELVDAGGHQLHVRCTGRGSPAVVIDTGAGDTASQWHDIQAQVERETRVCTYDRAGYGRSEPGPIPRSSAQEAAELRQLLENAGLEGPYVLVGHSVGGMNAQVFAAMYPDRVAGLVLLDPPPLAFITGQRFRSLLPMVDGQIAELRQAAQAVSRSTDPDERAKAGYIEAVASELAMMTVDSAEQASAIGSFGDVPLVVVAAGVPNPAFGDEAAAYQQFWIEQSRALAAKSTRGAFILAAESTHHLYRDVPDLVLEAIRQVLQQARGRDDR